MGTVAEGAEKQTAEDVTEAEDAAAAVIIKWEGGGESVVPLEEFKRPWAAGGGRRRGQACDERARWTGTFRVSPNCVYAGRGREA